MPRTTSYGRCEMCGERVSKAAMARHVAGCPERELDEGAMQRLLYLRVQSGFTARYWLDVEMGARQPLTDLDRFLRVVWLECCGHPSAFEIGGASYLSAPELGSPGERGMEVPVGELVDVGAKFRHLYDFGSTTELKVTVKGARDGAIDDGGVRLLAQNEPLEWSCGVCGAPATLINSMAMYSGDSPFYCDEHADLVDDDYGLLPVVNSPRMGVCAYGDI